MSQSVFCHAGAWAAVAIGVLAAPAYGQAPRVAAEHRWEIEAYGGLERGGLPNNATPVVQTPGAALTTSSPTFATREVSSWFFGDGASLLNGVNAAFGVSARVVPLEDALQNLAFGKRNAPAVGLRVRRGLAPGLWAEFSIDAMNQAITLSDAVREAIESSRAGYEAALSGLLATGPFTSAIVRATAASATGTSREIAITGAANFDMTTTGSTVPYLTIGAGAVSRIGDRPSAALSGVYSFSIANTVPIQETDRVTMRFEQQRKFVAVVGGGVRRRMTDRLGLRIDGRFLVGGHTTRMLFDATPGFTRGTPAGYIESFTTPAIQFSNDPSTGRRSSLSGPALQGFAPFEEKGLQTRFLLTVGVSARF